MSMFKRLARTFKLGKEKYFVGNDLAGNSFYERPSPEHDSSEWRYSKRNVEYLVSRPLSDYRFESIPVQWTAWMRKTRRHPPTIEELEKDWIRQRRVEHNVQLLGEKYKAEKLQLRQEADAERLAVNAPKPSEPVAVPTVEPIAVATATPAPEAQQQDAEKPPLLLDREAEQREMARLRRDFAKANAKSTGNPDADFKPESWSPAPVRRRT